MLPTITVQSRVDVPTILNLIAAIYPNSLKVLDELIDNGLDAGATQIWVVLETDRYSVIDNGRGMLPDVSTTDAQLIADFLHRKTSGEEDIRRLVSPLALKSLRWMVEFAGLSPKALEKGTRGVHGIGAIAPRLIADKIVWHTRPDDRLAHDYWGESPIAKNPPTFTLSVPTADQLARRDVTNQIESAKKPLADPNGNMLPSGTCVEMTLLREVFSPSDVASSLSKRFGNDIRNRGLRLVVVNRMSPEAKKKGGVFITVEPTNYQGIGVAYTQGFHKRGEYPFEVNLFYKPDGKGLTPQLMREGSPAGPITNIPELKDVYPWNTGRLTGYVEFSAPPNEAPWTAQKDRPQPSDRLNQWLQSLERIKHEVIGAIEAIEEKRRQQEQSHRTEIVEEALKEAMKQISSFKGVSLFIPAPRKRVRKRGTKGPDRKENLNTYVTVKDQYRRPVRNVQIRINKNGRDLLPIRITGLTGTCSLGVLETGRYTVSLVNEKRPFAPYPNIAFEINPSNLKENPTFTIEVPGPAPEERRISGLTIWMKDLGDAGTPYSIELLQNGFSTVVINNASYDFLEALDLGDSDAQLRLQTLYTAMALAEYSFPLESSAYQMAQAATLFNKAYRVAMESLPRKIAKMMTPHGRK